MSSFFTGQSEFMYMTELILNRVCWHRRHDDINYVYPAVPRLDATQWRRAWLQVHYRSDIDSSAEGG